MVDFKLLDGTDPKTGMTWYEAENWNAKPSRAVVACDGSGNGVVIWYVGGHLAMEIEEGACSRSIDSLGLDHAPEGISIWEGIYHWTKGEDTVNGYFEPEPFAVGKFREPTQEEWIEITGGCAPWNEAEWRLR